MSKTPLFFAAILCSTGTAALAAGQATETPASRAVQVTMPPGGTFTLPGRMGAAVKNAPYSADIVKERQQTLGDGNQIVQRSSARAYRDSAGRTREENLDDNGALRGVVIKDPVASVQWMLNPRTKTANRFAMPMRASTATITAPDDGNQHVLERQIRPGGNERMSMHRVIPSEDGAVLTVPEKSTLHIVPNRNLAPMEPGMLPPMNPLLSSAFGDIKWARQAQKRDLGPRDIDGVKATGQVRSYEIPAGEMGNRNAIVVSDETWYAPDLRITLSSKHSDPRTGDSVFRVENIKREEPAPALFAPPADYTVKVIAPRVRDGQ